MSTIKDTPLRSAHEALGGKMVEFAGWNMPIQYQGLKAEHLNVRKNVGLFDVSHMAEFRVRGDQALATLEHLTTNDVQKLEAGQAQYSLFGNHNGGIVDDLIVYCIEKNADYLLCVNAANHEKDWNWVQEHNQGADITDESLQWAQIAIQGPHAIALTSRVFGESVQDISPFHFSSLDTSFGKCLIAATGYTGEAGFEIFVPWDQAPSLWTELLKKGGDLGAQPIGLGARDTLRTEMKYSLYGHEIDDTTNPYEAGLGWVVKPKAKDFIGREAMVNGKAKGLNRKLVGFKMVGKGIPRQGYSLFSFDNQEIGKVTSGTLSPSLELGIGIAYLDLPHNEIGTEFHVEIRGRRVMAQVVKTPFVQPGGN